MDRAMATVESIVKELSDLSDAKLEEVSRFVRGLLPVEPSQEKARAALRITAGCLDGEEGAEFERAVREEADRIDADD